MAARARSSFRANGPRGFRRKAQYGWSAADPSAIGITNGTTNGVILAGSDWARGGGVSQSALLVGIRGGFAFNPLAVSGTVRIGIVVYDEGETIDSMGLITTLIEEDILWTWAKAQLSTVANSLDSIWVPIDVRSKRKLTLDSVVYLVITGDAAMGSITPMLRACIKFSG